MDLKITGTLTKADGFRHLSHNEWDNLPPEAAAWFSAKMVECVDRVEKAKDKGGPVSVKLECTVDGTEQKPHEASGITEKDRNKLQRQWQKLGDELLDIDAKRHAHKK